MYEKITQEAGKDIPDMPKVEVKPEDHNELSFADLGRILSAACDYWEINRWDVLDDDFFNDYFRW